MPRQLPLWAPPAVEHLVDCDGACIDYQPDVLDAAEAAEAFAALRDGVAWERLRRLMYEREVDVPRLTAFFSGNARGWPEVLRRMKDAVERAAGVPFDSAGLNFYRDGNDSVAPHNDDEVDPRASYVALVSLGATRRMQLRTKAVPRRTLGIDLEPGSLLVMSGTTQELWEHGIPKSTVPVGARISVAFRQRPSSR
jgi:alkylated DNA repair dioxygenase AlkB